MKEPSRKSPLQLGENPQEFPEKFIYRRVGKKGKSEWAFRWRGKTYTADDEDLDILKSVLETGWMPDGKGNIYHPQLQVLKMPKWLGWWQWHGKPPPNDSVR